MISWVIASLGFSFFVSNFADRGLTYGSLGTAVGLLVYLYLSVVLLGPRSTPPLTAYAEDKSLKPRNRQRDAASHIRGDTHSSERPASASLFIAATVSGIGASLEIAPLAPASIATTATEFSRLAVNTSVGT